MRNKIVENKKTGSTFPNFSLLESFRLSIKSKKKTKKRVKNRDKRIIPTNINEPPKKLK